MAEHCAICGCLLHRTAKTYARPTIEGRSHATAHHFVSERFFGRSANRKGTRTEGIFESCPWGHEGQTAGVLLRVPRGTTAQPSPLA
jgi:hypothetical protein